MIVRKSGDGEDLQVYRLFRDGSAVRDIGGLPSELEATLAARGTPIILFAAYVVRFGPVHRYLHGSYPTYRAAMFELDKLEGEWRAALVAHADSLVDYVSTSLVDKMDEAAA